MRVNYHVGFLPTELSLWHDSCHIGNVRSRFGIAALCGDNLVLHVYDNDRCSCRVCQFFDCRQYINPVDCSNWTVFS